MEIRGASETLKSARLEASRADLSAIYRVAYVSEASAGFGPDDLAEIGVESVQRNTAADITGILVFDEGKILQILEGERGAVMALFEKISRDPRHVAIRQVAGAEQEARLLSCWSVISGQTSSAPAELRQQFHELHAHLSGRDELEDVSAEEVELLKVMALFRSVPRGIELTDDGRKCDGAS